MIGQNNGPHNTADEIAEGITAIVTKLREKLPATKILLAIPASAKEYPT